MGAAGPGKRTIAHATDLGRYAGLGFQFAATLCVVGALGWWLDEKLGTSPWLLIAGVFLGATGGFLSLLRAVGSPSRPPREPRDPDRTPPA
jgi:F0F1-type ATP synthase assembly protein I